MLLICKKLKVYKYFFKINFPQNKNLVILSQLPFDFIKKFNLEKYRNINIQVETLIFGDAVERFFKTRKNNFWNRKYRNSKKNILFLKNLIAQ